MRKLLATSLLFSALLLTGCTSDKEEANHIVKTEQNNTQYKISNVFVMNNIKYTDLEQYKKQSSTTISQEIKDFVKEEGYTEDGYDANGYDRRGYNRNHIDKEGFSEDGYNLNNINEEGFTREGRPSPFTPPYNKYGYDANGYDELGFNQFGYDRNGYNLDGFDRVGESKNKGELGINEYLQRDWSTISTTELFESEIYLPLVNKAMKNDETLANEYYEEGMHPFSKQAYYINLLCNNSPSMMEELCTALRIESVSKLHSTKPSNRDEQLILQASDGEIIHVLMNEEFLPQRYEISWSKMKKMTENDEIELENIEGYMSTYKLIEKRKLTSVEQNYVDFSRQAVKESKGKWALAKNLFDQKFYQSVDQQYAEIKLSKPILDDLNKAAQQEWPKNYLSDSNEAIEGFNDESRENFIEFLMTDLSLYEQSKNK